MKKRALLTLLALLTACGSGSPPASVSPPAASVPDDQADPDDDTLASKVFYFDRPGIAAQSGEPLTLTLSVVRARNGKYKGYTRARAYFLNGSGAPMTGAIHVELGPVDGGPASPLVYNSTTIKIAPGAKKTAMSPYTVAKGRQCARASFNLTPAGGAAISAPSDAPVSVCDVDASEFGNNVISNEFSVSKPFWPIVRQTLDKGTQMVPGGMYFTYWPEILTTPTVEQVRAKLISGAGANLQKYNANFETQATGDFTAAKAALTLYGGGVQGSKLSTNGYIYRSYKLAEISKNNTKWKRLLKLFGYYSANGNSVYVFTYPKELNQDRLPVYPSVAVITGTGPLGTFTMLSDMSGSNRLDTYFYTLNGSPIPPPEPSVNDVSNYPSFNGDPGTPAVFLYPLTQITVQAATYRVRPLVACGAASDGANLAAGSLAVLDPANPNLYSGADVPGLVDGGGVGMSYSIILKDTYGDTRTISGTACYSLAPVSTDG